MARPKHGVMAVVVGGERPVDAVLWRKPDGDLPHDSGFSVLFTDAPEHADDVRDEDLRTICLHCLIEEYPEIGAGLDRAREEEGELIYLEGLGDGPAKGAS